MRMVVAALVVAFGFAVPSGAAAHSFDTIIVVPASGAKAEQGQQVRDGIQFAARERDAHPNETADGHLGGLDVHLLIVDSLAGEAQIVERARELSARHADDKPWVVAPLSLRGAIEPQVGHADFAILDLSGEAPWDIRTMDGQPFRTAFQSMFGYLPTEAVIAGYGAARQIDKVVRERN